ncbi:hypothetical protein ACEUZ9_002776 [Paracoccus litorisediminis]|uniref:hypothetical protein n=1 Tax=Paracoccus litorisediminis TaxID=2006130 RepID=UPI0037335B26
MIPVFKLIVGTLVARMRATLSPTNVRIKLALLAGAVMMAAWMGLGFLPTTVMAIVALPLIFTTK